jgi:hypothetical protein
MRLQGTVVEARGGRMYKPRDYSMRPATPSGRARATPRVARPCRSVADGESAGSTPSYSVPIWTRLGHPADARSSRRAGPRGPVVQVSATSGHEASPRPRARSSIRCRHSAAGRCFASRGCSVSRKTAVAPHLRAPSGRAMCVDSTCVHRSSDGLSRVPIPLRILRARRSC